jgi:hypothetical protein
VPLGVLAAYKQGTWIDRIVMGFSVLGFSVPGVRDRLRPDLRLRRQARLVPCQGYSRLVAGLGGFLQRLILPSRHALGDLRRADRAHDADERAGTLVEGLHPHGAGQGAGEGRSCSGTRCATPPCRSSP